MTSIPSATLAGTPQPTCSPDVSCNSSWAVSIPSTIPKSLPRFYLPIRDRFCHMSRDAKFRRLRCWTSNSWERVIWNILWCHYHHHEPCPTTPTTFTTRLCGCCLRHRKFSWATSRWSFRNESLAAVVLLHQSAHRRPSYRDPCHDPSHSWCQGG